MNNKTFEVLKWFALVIIPALATFVGLVGKALNWQYTDICVVIITGFGAFLGVCWVYQIEPTKCSRLKAKKEETNEKKITITAMSLLTALFYYPLIRLLILLMTSII